MTKYFLKKSSYKVPKGVSNIVPHLDRPKGKTAKTIILGPDNKILVVRSFYEQTRLPTQTKMSHILKFSLRFTNY